MPHNTPATLRRGFRGADSPPGRGGKAAKGGSPSPREPRRIPTETGSRAPASPAPVPTRGGRQPPSPAALPSAAARPSGAGIGRSSPRRPPSLPPPLPQCPAPEGERRICPFPRWRLSSFTPLRRTAPSAPPPCQFQLWQP